MENLRQTTNLITGDHLAQLVELDDRLLAGLETRVNAKQLAKCRQSMQPPETAWWWFVEPAPPADPWWNQFDWCWNLLTVGCLVLAGSIATQTAQAFSSYGLDIIGTFSTVTQGAGLVLVAGGALTDKGKQVVERALTSLKIPHSLHAEATFVLAGTLLLASYGIYTKLPEFGEFYYKQGQAAESEDDWMLAKNQYKRALGFIEGDARTQVALGKIYERLGQLNEAQKHYEESALSDELAAKVWLARIYLWQVLKEIEWSGKINAAQQSKLREAKTYLDLASKGLQEKERKGQLSGSGQAGSNKPENASATVDAQFLQQEVEITQGILLWAKSGLDAPNSIAKEKWLDDAEQRFKAASRLEYDLPTRPTGRRAECYQKIATYINATVNTQGQQKLKQAKTNSQDAKQKADECYSTITNQLSYDFYDVFVMSGVMEAKLGQGQSK